MHEKELSRTGSWLPRKGETQEDYRRRAAEKKRKYEECSLKKMAEEEAVKIVRSLLSYDPITGWLTWEKSRGGVFKGSRAGKISVLGCRHIRILERSYAEHRIAWLHFHGRWPVSQIDHINRIQTDNRIENLREVTGDQNMQNRGIQKNNTSGFPGVSLHRASNKWFARISVGGRKKHIGSYPTKELAFEAYKAAKKQYHPFSSPC